MADKPTRTHVKYVDTMIRKHGNAADNPNATPMSPAESAKHDSTFRHMKRTHDRHDNR